MLHAGAAGGNMLVPNDHHIFVLTDVFLHLRSVLLGLPGRTLEANHSYKNARFAGLASPMARFDELRRRGVGRELAKKTAGNPRGPWRLANSAALTMALPNIFFASLGLPSLAARRIA
jgi:hypothetical protein